MIEQELVKLRVGAKLNEKPVTIEWKGEPMIRNHSIKAAVLEIVKMSQNVDVVKINLIGNPGTGKSSLARLIAHLTHVIALKQFNTPYAVKEFNKKNLLNFEETLKTLQPVNHILIFDDVSFLKAHATSQQIEIVKQAETEIRHLEGGQDVKIIEIKNFHYTLGVDKYLRQNDYSFFTSVGSSEVENMQKIVGNRYTNMIMEFQKKLKMAQTNEKFQFNLGNKSRPFTYSYRNPFIPVLFHNGHTLRYVVTPMREWVDPICSTCANSVSAPLKSEINAEDFAKDLAHKFGIQIARTAVRIKLMQSGINVYPKRVKQALAYIEQRMENKIFSMEVLATYYNFKNDRTRRDTKTPEEENA